MWSFVRHIFGSEVMVATSNTLPRCQNGSDEFVTPCERACLLASVRVCSMRTFNFVLYLSTHAPTHMRTINATEKSHQCVIARAGRICLVRVAHIPERCGVRRGTCVRRIGHIVWCVRWLYGHVGRHDNTASTTTPTTTTTLARMMWFVPRITHPTIIRLDAAWWPAHTHTHIALQAYLCDRTTLQTIDMSYILTPHPSRRRTPSPISHSYNNNIMRYTRTILRSRLSWSACTWGWGRGGRARAAKFIRTLYALIFCMGGRRRQCACVRSPLVSCRWQMYWHAHTRTPSHTKLSLLRPACDEV